MSLVYQYLNKQLKQLKFISRKARQERKVRNSSGYQNFQLLIRILLLNQFCQKVSKNL